MEKWQGHPDSAKLVHGERGGEEVKDVLDGGLARVVEVRRAGADVRDRRESF